MLLGRHISDVRKYHKLIDSSRWTYFDWTKLAEFDELNKQ